MFARTERLLLRPGWAEAAPALARAIADEGIVRNLAMAPWPYGLAEAQAYLDGFEEAKADVMGAYQAMYMMDKGILPKADKPRMRATYIAGLFRAMRFGDTEAHGRGAAMQYRYLRAKGGIAWDASAKRFRIDAGKLDAGIRDLVGDIVRLQAAGDYAGTKAFLGKWAVMDAEAKSVTAQMGHIPVDIRPIFPDKI